MNETTFQSNNNWQYEGLLSEHFKFCTIGAFNENPFNKDDLKLLLDLNIYHEYVSPKNYKYSKNRMDREYGFEGFVYTFYMPGNFYFLHGDLIKEVHNKLEYFIKHINPSNNYLERIDEVNTELSKRKSFKEKLDYLIFYKAKFTYHYQDGEPAIRVMDRMNLVTTGLLQQHLCDKIYNYDVPELKEWAIIKEREEFILYLDNLIFENKMQADGKIIYDSSLNARQKVILLDKLVRMDINEWEANGARKHARIFDLLLPNSESYILDILKEINSSKKGRITSDYDEINSLYNSIVN